MAAIETAPQETSVTTAAPDAGPLVMLWAVPTLLSVETALWHLWPGRGDPLIAMIFFGVAFTALLWISAALRDPLMEMLGQMEYSTRVWFAVIHAGIFFTPLILLALDRLPAPWPLGCVALAMPLSATLVFARSCHYLLATLLLLWWGLLSMVPEVHPALPLTAFGLMAVATGGTHLHFRHLLHRRSGLGFTSVWIGTGAMFAVALPLGLAARALLPESLFIPPLPIPELPTGATPRVPPTISQSDLTRVVFEIMISLALAIGLVVLTGYVIKRMRWRRKPIPVEFPGETLVGEEWTLPPPRRRRRRWGRSPRERVIEAYLRATEQMQRRGWEFPTAMTAREFRTQAEALMFSGRQHLTELTTLFENAKYSAGEISGQEMRRAGAAAKSVSKALRSRA